MSAIAAPPIPLARPFLDEQEERAALSVLRSGRLTTGPELLAFEEELAASCGRAWAVCVSSGTAALHLSLWALGVGPGDVVRVPAFTFPATANVVRLVGAEVELVDVNERSWCMRLPPRKGDAERARSLSVHQFGFPGPVLDEARDVSDAACAIGVPPAMKGACACLSFHPRKVITTGEGGAIVGDDAGLRDELRALRSHGLVPRRQGDALVDTDGQPTRFTHFDLARPGLNARLAEPNAAIGRVQLRRLRAFLDERRALVARYRARLDGSGLALQADLASRAWQTFAVVLPDGARPRDVLRAELHDQGIETQVASYGLHTLAAYRDGAADLAARFPVADRLHQRALALPLWNGLAERDVDRVAEALLRALA